MLRNVANKFFIVAGLNSAMHKMGNSVVDDGDGKKITGKKALKHYRSGQGGIIDTDLNSIDFSNADLTRPVYDKNGNVIAYRINLDGSAFSNADDALVHGTITVERVKGNTFRVVKDPGLGCRCGSYDFEQHSWEPSYSKRNLATRYAAFVHKFDSFNIRWYPNAKPFIIRYNGTVKIGK